MKIKSTRRKTEHLEHLRNSRIISPILPVLPCNRSITLTPVSSNAVKALMILRNGGYGRSY